jgi:hypothetical protein
MIFTLHTLFIRCDRRTFDADIVALNSTCGFDGHLIIGFIPMFEAQIVVFAVDIDIRMNKLGEKQRLAFFSLEGYHLFDPCPDDTGHFISIEFNHWIGDFNSLLWCCTRS